MKTLDLPSHALATGPAPEQLRYARVLQVCTWAGLSWLAAAFAAYVAGLVPARVPPQGLPQLWGLPLRRYLAATSTSTGWHWLAAWPQVDAAMLLGIAMLVAAPALCLLVLLPLYARRRDRAYLAICAGTLGVALLAASGVLDH